MIRVRVTVSENFSGESANPGAITRIMTGDRRIPDIARIVSRIDKNLIADLPSSKASSLPLFVKYSVNTGIKEILRDPSAKSLLKRLGILKATKNASELSPAPKNHAITTSLIKPKMRLSKVAEPTTPAAFVTRVFSSNICIYFTLKTHFSIILE